MDDNDIERYISEIANKDRSLHALPEELSAAEQASIRRRAMERITGADFSSIETDDVDHDDIQANHCENLIGTTEIPLGLAGPLTIHSEEGGTAQDIYLPMATTEGALVASTNRGCSAIQKADGVRVMVKDVGMTRAPVFRTGGLKHTQEFLRWVKQNEDKIRETAEATSDHLKLLEIKTESFGTTAYLRFRFDTEDAMGMNMATIACDRAVHELIEPSTDVECIALSGNYCTDKKPSAVNHIEGRGCQIFAETILPSTVLENVLNTDAETLQEIQYRKNLLGSYAADSMGFNAHYANMVSAMFIACGQDPAHVSEASLGITCIEAHGDSAYVSIKMPDVPLGVVGGGTRLESQREALKLLNIDLDHDKKGKAARKFAEALGAGVLAGELSLLASFGSQDLARAHERLGREYNNDD